MYFVPKHHSISHVRAHFFCFVTKKKHFVIRCPRFVKQPLPGHIKTC